MWMQVQDGNLPDDLVAATSSIWQYDELIRVGVMKGSTLLAPPYLWAEVYQSNPKALREAKKLMDELQMKIHKPIVYAEAVQSNRANLHFLRFLGFDAVEQQDGVQLFKRSLT
jgi:hypothetical protein